MTGTPTSAYDRFTSKYPGQCPQCRTALLGFKDLDTPKKRDDRGWKKLELTFSYWTMNIQLCTDICCVPLGRPNKGHMKYDDLTLSQLMDRIRKQRTHHQGEVPQHKYRVGYGMWRS